MPHPSLGLTQAPAPIQWLPGVLFPKVLSNLSMRLTTHLCLLSWPRMSGVIPPLPWCLHGVDRYSFIFCYEGGRWRELIVAAGSRWIWNVTAFRMLWMFYEKYKRLENMHHCISLLIAVFLGADTWLSRKNHDFFLLAGEDVFIYLRQNDCRHVIGRVKSLMSPCHNTLLDWVQCSGSWCCITVWLMCEIWRWCAGLILESWKRPTKNFSPTTNSVAFLTTNQHSQDLVWSGCLNFTFSDHLAYTSLLSYVCTDLYLACMDVWTGWALPTSLSEKYVCSCKWYTVWPVVII